MSANTNDGAAIASAFLSAFIQREGGLAELDPDGGVDSVLTPELREATGLSEAARVRILGAPAAGETPLPLESAGLRWCLERALSRGHAASAHLAPRAAAQGVVASAVHKVQALNGTLRALGTRSVRLHATILEFRCEAVGEERLEISEYVAVECGLQLVSAPWARALLAQLPQAEPAAMTGAPVSAERAASLSEPHARALLATRLEPLRQRLAARMARDATRLVDYHQTLLDEALRRRRGTDEQVLEQKRAAIVRQRDHKLVELATRLAIDVRLRLTAAVELEYPASVCDLVLLRRKREIPLVVPWDPFLRAHLPRACQACSQPTFAFHACDADGHLTCAACASACGVCERVTCRACEPDGCRVCLRAVQRG